MPNNERFYLDCPYAEKDEAKALGARWDHTARKWYVPDDVDKNLFTQWWPEEVAEVVRPFLG